MAEERTRAMFEREVRQMLADQSVWFSAVLEVAEMGEPNAQHTLANMYFHRFGGLERSVLIAEQWNDKALANAGNHQDTAGMTRSMQRQLLAERLRRVKNAPLTQEMIPFTFKRIPTDDVEKQDAQTPRHSVSCEACGNAVFVDRGKKYCGECKVTMLQQRVSEGGLAASQEGVLQAVQGGYPSERVLREGQADVQSSSRRE